MPTTPPSVTQFSGAAPQRKDKSTFSDRFDAFITWFIACVVQLPALALNVYNNAIDAFNSAVAAALSAATATSAAAAALATSNAVPWASGVVVAQNAAVISQVDRQTYRRTTATGSGTLDPALDGPNYECISRVKKRTTSLASTSAPAPDASLADIYIINALAVAATFAAPLQTAGPAVEGQTLLIRIEDNGTARALAWHVMYRASTDLPLPTTTVAGKVLYVGFVYSAVDSKWDLLSVLSNF
jgi:hypothetical protein